MKHMSKHTMVEHLISHHSPQHRTESPTIPIRISLIWVFQLAPPLQRRFLFICARPEDFEPVDGFGKVPDCTSILWKDALWTNTLTFQRLLTGTSKDDITALLDGNWPQNSAPCDSTGGESALGSYIGSFLFERTTNVLLLQGSQNLILFLKSWQTRVVCTRNSLPLSPSIREGFCFCFV